MIPAVLLTCAQFATLDRTRVYEVPASLVRELTVAQRMAARACARRHGIRYRIVDR